MEKMIFAFPRRKDNTLKVSYRTQQRVAVWIEALEDHIQQAARRSLNHLEFLNERLNCESFVSSKKLLAGLPEAQRSGLRATISSFVREGAIESIVDESDRRYVLYRLNAPLVKGGDHASL